jgi:cysteinyl-tRNA synthetase
MPRATRYTGEMIAMIEDLIAKGHAYEAEGHVLFSVSSYPDYGKLSGRSVEDMIAGARVEVAPYKRDPMDFVLWKPSGEGLPGWDSPWGRGRPGWHIECSAMADALLGESFDIHGGGNDLMFPHHENEIAQSCCAHPGKGFARIWMHNEMLQVEGKKMSKSLGNFFTVRDLLDRGIPGEVIRFVFLSTHYGKPMDWTERKAREAQAELEFWANKLTLDPQLLSAPVVSELADNAVLDALANDLNTPLALMRLREQARFIDNSSDFRALSDEEQFRVLQGFVASLDLLGFSLGDLAATVDERRKDNRLERLTLRLAQERIYAKESKDFSEVDRLKSRLIEAGVEVRMAKDKIELVPGPDFDPSKLKDLA